MKPKHADIEFPLHTAECVHTGCDDFQGVPQHPFPQVMQVRLDGPSHAHLYELPHKEAQWRDRAMLCLLFKCDGLLFYWKTYQEDPRVHGLRTTYHLVWYWKSGFAAEESYQAKPTHTTHQVQHLYLPYRPNEGKPDLTF